MNFEAYPYLDGNAAAGELNRVFAVDVTAAQGRCGNCGAARHFAEAHLYVNCPGIVARCSGCGHVLLRLAIVGERMFLDLRGMTYLALSPSELKDHGQP
jgi:hypothetical protein